MGAAKTQKKVIYFKSVVMWKQKSENWMVFYQKTNWKVFKILSLVIKMLHHKFQMTQTNNVCIVWMHPIKYVPVIIQWLKDLWSFGVCELYTLWCQFIVQHKTMQWNSCECKSHNKTLYGPTKSVMTCCGVQTHPSVIPACASDTLCDLMRQLRFTA